MVQAGLKFMVLLPQPPKKIHYYKLPDELCLIISLLGSRLKILVYIKIKCYFNFKKELNSSYFGMKKPTGKTY